VKRALLDKWKGLSVKEAAKQEVDVVTGATYSSEALIENVRRGIDHFNKKKR
jgi:electron transport complex protein RnfG